MKSRLLGLLPIFFINTINAKTVNLDGKLDEVQWQHSQNWHLFYQVHPSTLNEAKNKVLAKAFANDEGIYIGIINHQKKSERKKQFNIKDGFMQGDFNRVYIDFSGDGSAAYLFSSTLGGGTQDAILTPQKTIDYDWDGDWQSQYYEYDDYWSNEIFIPWHTVSFRNKPNNEGLSEIGVSIQLYDIAHNYIYSNQQETLDKNNFYLNMPKFAADIPEQQQLSFIPYVTYKHNFMPHVANDALKEIGFDLIYKPNHYQKLSLAINPDFGQVDSDNVDINYSAIETLTTDKRPFFTQDINVFDVPIAKNTKLIHTRRMGAGSDDGNHLITAIDAALRFVHQGENIQVGAFAVQEDKLDSKAGRSFYATRTKYKTKQFQTGLLTTHVKRPWLNRSAHTLAWDTQYQSTNWFFKSAILMSETQDKNKEVGNGVSVNLDYQFSENTSINNTLLRLNKHFNNRDMGYLQRNNWLYMESKFSHLEHYSNAYFDSINHTLTLSYEQNTQGDSLPSYQHYVSQFRLNNGAQLNFSIDYTTKGTQDNIGYESSNFIQPSIFGTRAFYQSPYIGQFSWAASIEYDNEGIDGKAIQLAADLTWMPHANWRVKLNNFFRKGDGFLIANKHNQLSQYTRNFLANTLEISGLLTNNLELSSTVQLGFLEAKNPDVFYIINEQLHKKTDIDTSFDDKRLTAQFKLRYRMGPFSDIFFVYRRGAKDHSLSEHSSYRNHSWSQTIKSLWNNPNENNLTLKVRYLF